MSFTTRCPACGTMFRVVPDQLKISDGWVRCGHCSDVFDAMLNLQSETSVAKAASPVASPPPSPWTQPSASRVVVRPAPVMAPPSSPPPPPPPPSRPLIVRRSAPVTAPTPSAAAKSRSLPGPASSGQPGSEPGSSPDPGWGFVSQIEELDEGPVSQQVADDKWDGEWLLSPQTVAQHRESVHREMRGTSVVATAPARVSAHQAVKEDFERELAAFNASGLSEDPAASPLLKESFDLSPGVFRDSGFEQEAAVPGFVVQGRRDAFWRAPAMRVALGLLAMMLGGVLALQWVVLERDALAARHPTVAPAVQAVCRVVGCSLAAPRRINAVAIESSTLVRKLGQFYAFDLVVKNSETMAVAMPALELSLTDGRDKEIARRVFLPEDMPDKPTVVPAKGSLSVNMRLSLSETELSTMAGFRALVFYP